MKVNVEKIDNNKVVLELEVEQTEVGKAFDKAYHKLASQVNIPGFRKGKAPRNILEKRLGKEAMKEEALEFLVPKTYMQALDEQNIDPVSRPEIEVVSFEENQPLIFKATVITKPEVQLGDYRELKVEVPASDIAEEQVNEQIQTLANRHAKMVVVEDAVLENGDFAIIDFEGFIDDVPFKGGQGKAYPLEIGSGSFIAGFEEQLIGAKAGEEKDIQVTFPEEYHAEELAGKPALFKVTVQDIKRKEMPELNDDFAKDVSEFDTLQELKDDIKNKLEQAAKEKAERDFENAAVKLAVDYAQVDIPDIMIEDRIEGMIEDLNASLQNRGMQLDKYLEYIKMDLDTLRSNYRDSAENGVKTDLVLEAIAKKEELKLSPEDMEQEIASMAKAYGASVEDVSKVIRNQGQFNALAASILRKKSAKVITDSAIKG